MADIKINDLAAYTDPVSTDVLPIVDVGNDLTKKVSIADLLENAGTGSAGAPSFSFDGDNNTGIYRPGADQVAISTNGTGRLFVDSSGRLLVGASSAPFDNDDAKLQVVSSSVASLVLARNDGSVSADQDVGSIRFYSNDGGSYQECARIAAEAESAYANNDKPTFLSFSTTADSASSPTERLRIDSSGRLLLGTTTPGAYSNRRLTIATTSGTTGLELRSATNGDSRIIFTDSTSSSDTGAYKGQILYDQTNDFMSFNTNGNNERLRIDSSGNLSFSQEASSNYPEQKLKWSNDSTTTNGFYLSQDTNRNGRVWHEQGLDILFGTNNTERMRIDSSGNIKLTGDSPFLYLSDNENNWIRGSSGLNQIRFGTAGTERMRIDSSGKVGIGTSINSSFDLEIGNTGNNAFSIRNGGSGYSTLFRYGTNEDNHITNGASGFTSFRNHNGQERLRIDSSGRLLIGTSSEFVSTAQAKLQINGSSNSYALIGMQRNDTTVAADNTLGQISYYSKDSGTSNECARIRAASDAVAHTATSKGTKLQFYTTTEGTLSLTERMRIGSGGDLRVGNISGSSSDTGHILNSDGLGFHTRDAGVCLVVNRLTDDGALVYFRQATTTEGTISVSGTTVTYGGGHLARWSQLPNEGDPSSLLKGTVLSNLDEMCEWGEEDNEQLNRMKISDVEGDINVAGVFVSTSFDEEGPLDFFCAMTGDMIIRIAEGITVQRGDLLMSAGDGTAKPQDDDIIRSKTVAKVTSTHVTCTYADGSYCVPCVLMAC